jgi:hypothetical protein
VAGNKKQVVFEINAKKKRMRACAKKSLESATECGKVDAGRSAPKVLSEAAAIKKRAASCTPGARAD